MDQPTIFKFKDECPKCKGCKGKWIDGKWVTCDNCKGRGIIKSL